MLTGVPGAPSSTPTVVRRPHIMAQPLIFTYHPAADLDRWSVAETFDRVFVLTDENTHRLCLPVLADSEVVRRAQVITIPAGEEHKTLDTLQRVWTALSEGGATRHSCLINLGGGVVTDLGGFAAATFKRGITFVNIPTTLLAMVDASVGGKTGIDFCGLKNEIGAFADARTVLLSTQFLATLDREQMLSGFAEMLKHALLCSREMLGRLLCYDILEPDLQALQAFVEESVGVKQRVVLLDPTEQNMRKALNLGHTVGHAVESLCIGRGRTITHGHAVAVGLVCELYLSAIKTAFPQDTLRKAVAYIREHYPVVPFTCDDYDELFRLMLHDKKNTAGEIRFTLLRNVGEVCLDAHVSREEIEESLDFYREG